MLYFGFRNYMTVNYTTPNQPVTLDPSGAVVMVEVTNSNTGSVTFYPNPDLPSLTTGGGIPIPGNSTRQIPMRVYSFTATGNVTVVAYKQ